MVIYLAFLSSAAGTVVGTVAWLGWYRRPLDEMSVSLACSTVAALPGVALAGESVGRTLLFPPSQLPGAPYPSEPHAWNTTLVALLWIFVGFMSLLAAAALREKPVPRRANVLQAIHVATWALSSMIAFLYMAMV